MWGMHPLSLFLWRVLVASADPRWVAVVFSGRYLRLQCKTRLLRLCHVLLTDITPRSLITLVSYECDLLLRLPLASFNQYLRPIELSLQRAELENEHV